jgi:hypothetical protein
MIKAALRVVPLILVCALAGLPMSRAADAQTVDPTPSRKTLDDASKDNCASVSLVVQRCPQKPDTSTAKPTDDALTKSRAQTKAAFDRRDQRARDEALKGEAPSVNTPVGDAQRIGGVTVLGTPTENPPQPEEVVQRALTQPAPSANGTVSKYGANGTRYDCIEKCVGPACCVEVRAMPNPAREINSLNGH